MNIQLRFFASIREAVGTGQERLVLPPEVATIGDLRTHLCERGGQWAEALAGGRALRMACNQQIATADTPLTEGSEIAFFPPVTGG